MLRKPAKPKLQIQQGEGTEQDLTDGANISPSYYVDPQKNEEEGSMGQANKETIVQYKYFLDESKQTIKNRIPTIFYAAIVENLENIVWLGSFQIYRECANTREMRVQVAGKKVAAGISSPWLSLYARA
uniref:Uncharacterized protein n=1 Tax=Ditylenchus dipsaci TaxID=166011 RepID=A0A915DA70_9BILA